MELNNYTIPASILIAGALIAGAVFYSADNSSNSQTKRAENGAPRQTPPANSGGRSPDNIKPVGPKDHIMGDPNAPVKIVEFSDLECPFCKRFHPTMLRLMDEYGKSGQAAWVYRHFPIGQLHSKARKEAEAAECANELGGNDAFWAYIGRMFEITPSNDRLDLALLPQIAEYVGLGRRQFESCLNSGKYGKHIEDDFKDAIASGGSGTPYSIVIAPNKKTFPITGAQPYGSIKSIVDLALKEK